MIREIPRSMIQLAHENDAKLEHLNPRINVWESSLRVGSLSESLYYRIANKTADGLRLDELLELAEWDLENIGEKNTDATKFEDIEEWLYWTCRELDQIRNISLKKQEPKMRPMTAQEVAELPRGTAFYNSGSKAPFYSPTVEGSKRTYIHGTPINSWDGYILPNETELRKFVSWDV